MNANPHTDGEIPSSIGGDSQRSIPPERNWEAIVNDERFETFLAAKRRFIFRAFSFFLMYYFGLAVLAGFLPDLLSIKVAGPLNLAYIYALSQFPAGWLVAGLYMKTARKWDNLAEQIKNEQRSSI